MDVEELVEPVQLMWSYDIIWHVTSLRMTLIRHDLAAIIYGNRKQKVKYRFNIELSTAGPSHSPSTSSLPIHGTADNKFARFRYFHQIVNVF